MPTGYPVGPCRLVQTISFTQLPDAQTRADVQKIAQELQTERWPVSLPHKDTRHGEDWAGYSPGETWPTAADQMAADILAADGNPLDSYPPGQGSPAANDHATTADSLLLAAFCGQ